VYEGAWRQFVAELDGLAAQVRETSQSSRLSLHEILTELLWVPYREAHKLADIPRVHKSARNIGAVTGLFFEYAACAVIIPAIEAAVPGCRFERNSCSDANVRKIARDPDLFASQNGRHAVFEFKVSPKRREFAATRRMHELYATAGVEYFLVGGAGYVAAPLLEAIGSDGWACVLAASAENEVLRLKLPTLDTVVSNTIAHLLHGREE
jgi:hypothetical protein